MFVTFKNYLKTCEAQQGTNTAHFDLFKKQHEFNKLMVRHLEKVSKNIKLNRLEREELDQFVKDNLSDSVK